MGVAVGILVLSRSVREIHCTSGSQSAILFCGSRLTSDNVGSVTGTSEWSESGVAVRISGLSRSVPEIQCTSGLQSTNLNCGSRPTYGSVT
jgi:hypothetical protein